MALRNIMNRNAMQCENFDAHNQLRIVENADTITHQINELTGEYTIKNSANHVILSTDTSGNLTNNSKIKQHVADNVLPLSRTIATHTTTLNTHHTRLTAVEQATGVESLEIEDILTNGNNANNLSITGLNNISTNTISIDGLEFSNIDGDLSCPASIVSLTSLFAPLINTNSFGCDGDVQGTHIIGVQDVSAPLINCDSIECTGDIASQNITTMMDNITLLIARLATALGSITSLTNTSRAQTTYINKCKLFFDSFKDAIYIESEPESGIEFDYTGLSN